MTLCQERGNTDVQRKSEKIKRNRRRERDRLKTGKERKGRLAGKTFPVLGRKKRWLRALASLTEDPDKLTSSCNSSFRASDILFWPP